MEIALAQCTVTNAATAVYTKCSTNTEIDSGIQSDINGILTDLIARVQQRGHNILEKEIKR